MRCLVELQKGENIELKELLEHSVAVRRIIT